MKRNLIFVNSFRWCLGVNRGLGVVVVVVVVVDMFNLSFYESVRGMRRIWNWLGVDRCWRDCFGRLEGGVHFRRLLLLFLLAHSYFTNYKPLDSNNL